MSGVARGLSVIEQVVAAEEPPSHADLARATRMAKSTLTAVLSELMQLGYVVQTGKGYGPGGRLINLGYTIARAFGVSPGTPDGIHSVLAQLARETGETAVFSVEVGRTAELAGQVLAVDHVQSQHPMRYVAGIGQLQPVAHTAAGYALLAFSGRDSRAIPPDTLYARNPNTLVELDAIDRELERTRARGYAHNIDRSTEGVTSIAFPWPFNSDTVSGAISIVGPTQRMQAIEQRVLDAVRTVTAERR
jgi:DNA-binding IclR family transcriptional regulator